MKDSITRAPEPEETFRINWEPNPSGYLEWHDAKLAVTFPETAESREIEFRPGWLPEELASLKSDAEAEMNNAGISFMEMQETVPFRLTNEMAHKAMKTVAGLFNSTSIENLPICDIIVAVQKLRKRGLSYGQISRELSKNKGTVYRWANKEAV